jgi:hypothetical protein
VVDLQKAFFENPGDVVPKHVGHQNIRVFPITHTQRYGDILYNIQIILEEAYASVEKIDLEVFLFLTRYFSV